MLKRVCFVLAILMVHSSASACSDLNGDGVVNVADFLIQAIPIYAGQQAKAFRLGPSTFQMKIYQISADVHNPIARLAQVIFGTFVYNLHFF